MAAQKFDLVLESGATVEITLKVKNVDGVVKLPGVTVDAEVVEYIGTIKQPSIFLTEVIPDDGIVILSLPLEESKKLQTFSDDKKHYWNVFFNYPDGKRKKRIDGNVKVKKAAR